MGVSEIFWQYPHRDSWERKTKGGAFFIILYKLQIIFHVRGVLGNLSLHFTDTDTESRDNSGVTDANVQGSERGR